MKMFLKNIGILVILIGAIIAGVNSLYTTDSNTPLAIGGGLIVLGLILQVILGQKVEE